MSYFIIGASFSHFVEAANTVNRKTGISPAVWTVHPKRKSYIEAVFNKTTVLNAHDLTCGAFEEVMEIAGINNPTMSPLSPAWQKKMGTCRLFVIENLLHRSDFGGAYTLQEIVHTVNEYFLIAYNLIREFKPKLIVYVVAPHTMYDLALFFVAKELGLKNIMFMDTHAPNIAYAVEDFLSPRPFIGISKKLLKNEKVKDEIFQKFLESRNEETPHYMKRGGYLGRDKFARNSVESLLDLARVGFGCVKNAIKHSSRLLKSENEGARDRLGYEKIRGVLLEEKTKNIGCSLKKAVFNVRLESDYKKITKDFHFEYARLEQRYVYVPLSMQVERTTMPCAGFMYNQLLYIRMLAGALPENWKIIVKENPKQFLHIPGAAARDRHFYRLLVQLGILFAPLDFSSHELEKNSSAVAVTTGTAGFEARTVHRKPVLAFADNWYAGLPGVYVIKTWESLCGALQEIDMGAWKNDDLLLNDHLRYLKESAIYFYPDEGVVLKEKGDLKAMSENLAAIIIHHLETD